MADIFANTDNIGLAISTTTYTDTDILLYRYLADTNVANIYLTDKW